MHKQKLDTKATRLEQWADSLELDPIVKILLMHPLPATAREKWMEAVPFPVVDVATIAPITLRIAQLTIEIATLRARRWRLFEAAVAGLCGHPDCSSHGDYECAFCNEKSCAAHIWLDMPVIQGEESTVAICWRCEAKLTEVAA